MGDSGSRGCDGMSVTSGIGVGVGGVGAGGHDGHRCDSLVDQASTPRSAAPQEAAGEAGNSLSTHVDPGAACEPEVIAGYQVHPAASLFPLLAGKEFEDLCESMRQIGPIEPVVLKGDVLMDGRNRLLAEEWLRSQGHDIEVPRVQWEPVNGESETEWILARNLRRRHLTPDQAAAIAVRFLPLLREESRLKQEASQFKSGDGNGGHAAASGSTPPSERVARTSREKDEASTAGMLAKLANVSIYKARQAADLEKAMDAGLVSPEVHASVVSGEAKLSEVLRPVKSAKKPRRKPEADDSHELRRFDGKSFWHGKVTVDLTADELDETDELDEADESAVSRETFEAHWEQLKAVWPITEHRELRRIAVDVISDEQRRFDRT